MSQQIDRTIDRANSDETVVRRSRSTLWVLGVILAMAVAVVAGVAVTAYLPRPSTNAPVTVEHRYDPTVSAVGATEAYLDAMMNNDQARARAALCSKHHDNPFGSGAADPMLGSFRNLTDISSNGVVATITVTLTFEPGAGDVGDMRVRYTVVKDAGGWLVCDVEQVEQ